MLQPEAHLDVVRQRHSDLLRQARTGELAVRVGEFRRAERRSFLARLQPRPGPCQTSTRTAPV
jgi:hypothetical protein